MLGNLNIGNRVFERHLQSNTRERDLVELKEQTLCPVLLDDTLSFFDVSPSEFDLERTDPGSQCSRLEHLSAMMKDIDAGILKSTEMEFILKSLDAYCDHDGMKFFSKSSTGIARSFSISKLQDDKYGPVFEMFLKPIIKNTSSCVSKGSYKIVKRGAVQIVVSLDKQQIISVTPQVTVSKDRDGHKNDDLDKQGLLHEGFHLMAFHDDQKNQDRKIYRLPDLGEPLDTCKGRTIFRELDPKKKKRVCLDFIQHARDLNAFDIKSANALISSTGKISIIDHSTKIFTFTPGTFIHGETEGFYGGQSETTCQEARILSLTIVLLMLIEGISWSHYGRQFSYDEYKISSKSLRDKILEKAGAQSDRPLLKALVKAYECCLSYEGLIAAVEASFEE